MPLTSPVSWRRTQNLGGNPPYTFSLQLTTAPEGFAVVSGGPGVALLQQNGVTVRTISFNEATGQYEITQNAPILHPPGGEENDLVFVVTVTATDADGDTATGTITITYDDDTPGATDAQVGGTVDEDGVPGGIADGPGDVPGVVTVVNGSVASLFLSGADGPLTYGLSSNTSGLPSLTSNGVAVTYVVAGDTLTASAGGNPVFTLEVNADGSYTFTLLDQLDHATLNGQAGDNTENDLSLALGSIIQATDIDGDPVTAPANGLVIVVDDDTPTAGDVRLNSSVELDETNGGEPVSAGAPIEVTSSDPMISGASVTYGADGQGPDPVYGLSLLGGVNSLASGLMTADGDHAITLVLTSSTLITATYQDGGTQTAFTIQMNTDGTVTVRQFTALEHLEDGPPGPDHDDALDLVNGESNLVNATITFEDFDGDEASASVPIGQAIVFRDDGPSIDITAVGEAEVELITDDDGTEGSGSTSNSSSADFSGVFSVGSSNGGGDGTASANLLSYSLAVTGSDSGLFSHGVAINLYLVGDVVVGATGPLPADLNDADIVFTVEVDSNGVVTLTQLQQVDHPAVDDPDGTDSPFNDHLISMEDDGLITLTANGTITDNDGDTASDSETIDIASNLVFRDDGPTINAVLDEGASLHVDEIASGCRQSPERDGCRWPRPGHCCDRRSDRRDGRSG